MNQSIASEETQAGAVALITNARVQRDLSEDVLMIIEAIATNDFEYLSKNFIRPEAVVASFRRAYKI